MTKEDGKKQSSRGELQRRWRSLLADGSMASLRSEGRLVALYVLQVADWSTCEASFSIRRAADGVSVRKNTIFRGLSQLLGAGILEVVRKGSAGRSSKYRVLARPRTVVDAPTSGVPERPHSVGASTTSGGRVDHERWARRLRAVGASTTHCGRNSFSSTGFQSEASGGSSEATPAAGEVPAEARQEDKEAAT
jgi:hypothetical protein